MENFYNSSTFAGRHLKSPPLHPTQLATAKQVVAKSGGHPVGSGQPLRYSLVSRAIGVGVVGELPRFAIPQQLLFGEPDRDSASKTASARGPAYAKFDFVVPSPKQACAQAV